MKQPSVLDLFCGAGGGGEGYARAGYHVVGCDTNIRALRENYHESYEDEAISVLDTLLDSRWWRGHALAARHRVSRSHGVVSDVLIPVRLVERAQLAVDAQIGVAPGAR